MIRLTRTPHYARALDAVRSIPGQVIEHYRSYWQTLLPRTAEDVLRRFLFAYASVRTTWEINVRTYQALVVVPGNKLQDPTVVNALLLTGRSGLWKTRGLGIVALARLFQEEPAALGRRPDETLADCRERLVRQLYGLGRAKVSFALEMCHPLAVASEDTVLCIDTHMLQLYGLARDASPTPRVYHQIEQHFVSCCQELGYPAYLARQVLWDANQGRILSSYWSHVFHEPVNPV